MNLTKNLLIYTIKIGLFGCLFIPLIVTKSTFFPFVFGKAIVFQILVEICFILWIVWRIKFNENRHCADMQCQAKTHRSASLQNYSLIFFFLILIFTTLTSLDSIRSFWSTQERMTGLFNLLHFGMFYIMLITIFRKKDFIWFLRVCLIVSVIISIITLKFYWTPGRLSGPLGNPGFLALYLLFNIFFGIWLILKPRSIVSIKDKPSAQRPDFAKQNRDEIAASLPMAAPRNDIMVWLWRMFYTGTIILNFIVFYYARTRGAYLGLGIGLLLFVLINSVIIVRRSKNWSDWRRWTALSVLIIFLGAGVFAGISQKSAFLRGSRARTISWRISFNAFKARPILGWGPENYILAFAKHFDPQYAEQTDEWFDKAHNNVFEYLVTIGIFGLLAYLLIFILASIRSPGFIMPLLAGYFIANLFWIETTVSLMLLFLVLALAHEKNF